MQRISKHTLSLTIAMGAVGLVALLLVLVAGPQPAAQAAGDTLRVPDDYATIQAAIDAANDGDTVQVAQGTYGENLSITEGITLTGGWDPTFTTQTPGDSTIDGQGLGRVISITCPTSDTLVTIDGFTIEGGDATGLGGPPEVIPAVEHNSLPASMPPDSPVLGDASSISAAASRLRADLGDLAARGLYPGGPEAYQAMAARLDRLTAEAEQAQARSRPAQTRPEQSADSGGGIYSWNASLHLLNSNVQFNVGSSENDAHGGGIFVGQAAEAGVRIADNVVQFNTASNYGQGHGGGLYLYEAPGAVVERNRFLDNAASNGGLYGAGGGLSVDDSPGVLMQLNHVERNTAHASWACPPMGGGGGGGGAQFSRADDATVADNVFRDNLAAFHCGSHTGGMYVYRAANLRLEGNEFLDNWGVLFQIYSDDYGGGLGVDTVYSATITSNILRGNSVSLVNPQKGLHVSYGGGLFGYSLTDSKIRSNEIRANVASGDFTAFGGGMHLEGTEDVTVTGNLFAENAANLSTSGGGHAGALSLSNTVNSLVRHNGFHDNRSSAAGPGLAGGLYVQSYGPHSFDTTVDANLFIGNQASGDAGAGSRGGAGIVLTHGFTLTNNVIAGNTAAGVGGLELWLFEGGEVTNNSLAGNSDTAVVVHNRNRPVTFTNNIVVSHTVGISVAQEATATVRYTLWDNNGTDIAGAGTISESHPVFGNPGFAKPADDDYHLTAESAAIDAGDPAGVPPAPPEDHDGVARPHGPAVDLGAYEWRGYLSYLPMVSKALAPRTGWAVGTDKTGAGVIFHTSDSGLTWEVQGDSASWTGQGAADVSAVDAQTAWVALDNAEAGTDGSILHTNDGGATWVTQTVPAGVGGMKGIKGLSRDEAWAASLGGTILHTTDGGGTWNVVPHPTAPITQVNRMDAMGTDVWIADAWGRITPKGAVVHTQDGGLTWRTEHLPQDGALTVHAFSPMAAWASGTANTAFYRTVNGGEEWAKASEVGFHDHLDDICAAGSDDVWGVQNGDGGAFPRIWRVHVAADGTSDARNVAPPELATYQPGGITCLDTDVAWAVAQEGRLTDRTKPDGIILHTTNGGATWVQQPAPTDVHFWKISFVGARR